MGSLFPVRDCLVGLVVKAFTSRAEDLGFKSRFRSGDFSGLSHAGDRNWRSSGYPARRLVF